MAHIEDRWYRVHDGDRVPTPLCGRGLRYRVRYTDPDGRERSKSFPDRDKRAAEAFLVTVEADKLRGSYIDPKAGRISLRRYASEWLAAQTFDESTREATESRLRVHVYPYFGDRGLASIRPSHVQAWDRALQQQGLAPTYRRLLFANLSAIFSAAVDDERLAKNPCRAASVKPPRLVSRRITPWTVEQVLDLHRALPARYRVAATIAAGCGLRQGEVFGLAVEDVEFLGRTLHVVRQVKMVRGKWIFALPKGRKTRNIPLPETVATELAAHITAFPPLEMRLPWETPGGEPVIARLLLYSRERKALDRRHFNAYVWKTALTAAGIEPSRANGMHALRHFYASVLLDAGESIKALSEYLGHSDPGFTLRTYTHLLPASDQRTRDAVDQVFAGTHQPRSILRGSDSLGGKTSSQ
jgi:integrase